ncbi:putative late blight resistance protein homolog R1B-16 [Coffea eugenioides]|uniref:putative late blight resistance protein homolog R1B-16 n=1 Tax=Coffea eugenioides TaxID=49369 RepID=UPI000F607EC5|nr:putative late blight resistance protein homolog R1B-16 [Coffea eugenioides]
MEEDGWEAVAEGLSSDIVCGTEHCMNILEMSYRYLPDYTIWNVTKLRHLHISGGFLHLTLAGENLENSHDLKNIDTFFTPILWTGPDIVRWTGPDDQFPFLQKLVVQNCMQLIQVPDCLRHISTLKAICSKFEVYSNSSEMGSACIDAIFHNLELLDKYLVKKRDELGMLKLELRILRTLFLCSRKCGKDVCLESDDNKHVSLRSSFARLQDALQKFLQRSVEEFSSSELEKVVSEFRKIIGSFKEEIKELYSTLVDCPVRSSSPARGELMETIDSLLKNLEDLKWSKPYDQAFYMVRAYDKVFPEFIEALEERLMFFRNFILYVTWRGVRHGQLENLSTQFEVLALRAALATCMYWFDRNDKMFLIFVELQEIRADDPQVQADSQLIPELLQKIKADDLGVLEIYVQLLIASTSSESSNTQPSEKDLDILGQFVDSLLVLYEHLRFLKTILMKQQEKLNDLDENLKDLVPVVVSDAGILNKHPATSILNSPRINKVGFTDNSNYGFVAVKDAKVLSHEPPQGSIQTIDEVIVGLHDETETIVNQLTRGSMKLDMVSILGMPGLGKTTLAKKIYNDPRIRHHFHVQAWCHVSQAYCMKNLLLEILGCIVQTAQYSGKDEDDLALELFQSLKKNRYLIVLDDIWDIEAWNGLHISFPDDKNGSRILLTSQLHKVAEEVKTDSKLHPLRQLTYDESWELLQKKICCNAEFPPELVILGQKIAKNCNGLPLIIVIIAGILVTTNQDGWEEVATRLGSNTVCGTKECMDALELSYKNLPDYLKPCFLYFAAFPKVQEVPVWKLTSLWIAENFVQKSGSRSLEEVAEAYMMDLINRSLVMVAEKRSFTGVQNCSIHDLLVEFCVAKAKEEKFLCVLHGSEELFTFNEPGSCHRLCIHTKMCNISFIFRICKLLKVLDLEQFDIGNTFPTEIELLATIWKLEKLRHLFGIGDCVDISLSEDRLDSYPGLFNLVTFSTLTLSAGPSLEKIQKKFPSIRKLKCRISASVESTDGCSKTVQMDILSQLESLKLFLGHYQIKFQFPENLKKLSLEYFPWSIISMIGKLPNLEVLKLHTPLFEAVTWDMEEGEFPKLRILKLINSKIVKWTGSDDHFPNLQKLVLQQCWKLEEIPLCLSCTKNLETIEVLWCSPSTGRLVREVKEEQNDGGNMDLKILILEGA